MVAIIDCYAATLYNCTKDSFLERLNSEKGDDGIPKLVNHDENGNVRSGDGMVGLLFLHPQLPNYITSIGCDAVFFTDPSKQDAPFEMLEPKDFGKIDDIVQNIKRHLKKM